MNDTNLDLEPRLVEYLKRKKFYEEQDINTVSLERQYQISKQDLKIISEYQNKDNNICNSGERQYIQRRVKNYDENTDLIDCSKARFPSNDIVDTRLERINEKMKRERDASRHKFNTDNLKDSYDMYSRNFSSTTSKDFDNEFSLDNVRDEMNSTLTSNFEANSPSNVHELINPSTTNHYNAPKPKIQNHYAPQIQYNQRQQFQRPGNQDKQFNFGSGYTYRKPETPQFQRGNTFDIDNKVNIPTNNCRKSDLNALYYNVGGGEMKNIDYENYVKYGYPTSKARSLGFENPAEHAFHFIDSDIQDPKHVIFDRPISSRLDNKATAKSKNRDIY